MAEIEIGRGKSARQAFALDDVMIVPTRRIRDSADVDLGWKIDAYRLDLPMVAAGLEGPVTTNDAIAIGERGGLAMIDLEAMWADAGDPGILREQIAKIKSAEVRVAAAVSPARALELTPHAVAAEVDLVAIQGAVVSAEHVSTVGEPLNLKTFIRTVDLPVIVGGCASHAAALHLMRTGAAGVIVGVDREDLGIGAPLATAIADARSARVRHLDETGVYCHLIARGPISTGADIAKAVAVGADAVLVDASVLLAADGDNGDVVGNLREALATCGYTDLKSFQKAEVVLR